MVVSTGTTLLENWHYLGKLRYMCPLPLPCHIYVSYIICFTFLLGILEKSFKHTEGEKYMNMFTISLFLIAKYGNNLNGHSQDNG